MGEAMAAGGGQAGRTGSGRWRAWLYGTAAVLFLGPALAALLSDGPGWDRSDYIVMGLMVGVGCALVELGAWISPSRAYRWGVGIATLAGFLMTWMNLAVGIIGNEENPLNLMFAGVLLVGAVGALLSRLRAAGLARTLVVMAVAQGLVALVAQLFGYFTWPLNAFYATVWLVAAAQFRKAAREAGG